MKKIYTLLAAVAFTAVSFAQQNLDMESWSGTPATADNWVPLTAQDSMFQSSGVGAITGNYSLGVKNVYKDDVGGNDSIAGSWIYQDMAVTPDSVKMNCAPVMLGTDTARVMVYTWNGGSPSQVFLVELHAGNTSAGSVYTLTYDLTGATAFDAISVDFYSSKSPDDWNSTIILDDVEIFEPSGAGLNENGLTAITAYPNPANDMINFNLGNNDADMIQIIDLSGRVIENIQVNQSVETLSVSEYQNGVYFYQVINEGETVTTEKFVVRK